MGMTEEDRRRLKGGNTAERLAVRPQEAAVMIGESRSTVYRLIHTGALIAVKRGSGTLVMVDSIHRHLDNLPRFDSRAA
jgi:excisionase family DNA binding protein